MAVIREQRQFKIGPIGVARASSAGTITGQAIAQSANVFEDMFYRRGLAEAEKLGTELGKAVDLSDIKAIDPKTQKPVALNETANMGRARADAFQRVVNARFEQSIEEEIHNKASVLATTVDGKANAVSLFRSGMEDYLAEMAKNAGDNSYQEFIMSTGSLWTERSVASLQEANIKRQKDQAKADLVKRNAFLNDQAFDLGLSGDSSGFNQMQQFTDQDTSDLAAVINEPSEKNKSVISQSKNFALGLINNKMTDLTPDQRFNLIQSLNRHATGGVPLAPEVQAVKEQILKYLPNDSSDIMDFAAKADVFRKNLDSYDVAIAGAKIAASDLKNENLKQNVETKNLEFEVEIKNDTFFGNAFADIFKTYDQITVLRTTRDRYINNQEVIGKENVSKTIDLITKAEDQALTGFLLSSIENSKLTASEIKLVKQSLSSKSVDSLKSAGLNILPAEEAILTNLISVASSERLQGIANDLSERLKDIDSLKKKSSKDFLDANINNFAAKISDSSINNLEANFDEIKNKISSHLSNVDKPEEYLQKLNEARNKSYLNDFMGKNKNNSLILSELNLLASNPSTKDEDLLALSKSGRLDDVRDYLKSITNVSDRTSLVTRFIERSNNLDQVRTEKQQEAILNADANLQYQMAIFETQLSNVSNYTDLEKMRVRLRSTIKASATTSPKVREELFNTYNKSISRLQVNALLSEFTTEEKMNEALAIINSPNKLYDKSNNFISKDEHNFIVSATKQYGSKPEDWAELGNYANGLKVDALQTLKDKEADDLRKLQTATFDGLGVINNPNLDSVQSAFKKHALDKFGLDLEPPDLFHNVNKYLGAEEGSLDAQGGKLLNFYFKRSREILSPSLKLFLKRGAMGGTFNGQPVDLESLAVVWRNVGSYTTPQNEVVRSNVAIDSFDSQQVGILDGISEAAKGGIPTEYLDDVRTALSDPKIDERLIANYGDRVIGDFSNVYDIVAKAIGSEFEASPQLHTTMENYARGLFVAGVDREKAFEILDNHFDSYFSVDNYTVDLTGNPLNERTIVNLNTVFGDKRDSVIRFAEQALIKEIGQEAYEDNYLLLTTLAFQGQPRNPIRAEGVRYFATKSDLDFKGKKMLFLFPTVNSSRRQAEFRFATLDPAGQVMPLVNSNVVIRNFGKGVNFDLQRFIVEEKLLEN